MKRVVASLAALAFAISWALAQVGPPIGPGNGGGGGGGGGVSGLTTLCPASGPSTGAVTLDGKPAVNAQVGTTYTVATTDCGGLITQSNASASAYTLPATGVLPQHFVTTIANLGAGTLTISANASGSINGAATLALTTGQSAQLVATDANGLIFAAMLGKGGSSLTVAGSSGAIQTNNGSGNLGSIAPGTNVATALAVNTESTGSFVRQNGAPTAGNLLQWSASGAQDGGVAAAGAYFDTGPGYITGGSQIYAPAGTGGTATGSVQAAAVTLNCHYGYFRQNVTVTALGLFSTTAGSTGWYLGVYSNGANHRPATLLAYATAAAASANGSYSSTALVSATAFTAGTPYWFCSKSGDVTEVAAGIAASNPMTTGYLGSSAGARVLQPASNIAGITCAASACTGSALVFQALNTAESSLATATWSDVNNVKVPAMAFTVQ